MSSTCTTEDLADMRRLGKGNLVDAFIMLTSGIMTGV